ncbi:MAG: peptidase MA family metallohydrolase [candidate division KSB1 bacterium]|jgi:hypothetical protein|nr:peptidase MA family metallohydrolase [candidate division KSB1 bacterium]
MLKKLRNVGFALFLGFVCISTVQGKDLNWSVIDSPPFRIHYIEPDRESAKLIGKTIDTFYPRLRTELGYSESSAIRIYLCKSEDIFNTLGMGQIPHWSAGFAVPGQKTIVLKTYTGRTAQVKTTIHEITHILLHGATGNKYIPRWFNEGLAVYYSDDKEFASSSLISKALITNSLIPLGEIDRVLSFHTSKAQLAYQQSYLTVIFIIDTYGVSALKHIVKALSVEGSADEAFKSAIGLDLSDFEKDWLKYIEQKHRWNFLIDFESYLWVFILLLFILGFILIRRRNKKTLQHWEEEDEFYGFD